METNRGKAISILGIEPTICAIQARYQPRTRYRVSEYFYPPETYFHGTGVEAPIFVLAGSIGMAMEDDPERFVNVKSGEYLMKPYGGYRLRVDHPLGAKVVWVLEAPTGHEWQ